MTDIEITATEHGPYKVTGSIRLLDLDGRAIDAPGPEVYLCRCGHSANKPFCDGSHRTSSFNGTLDN